MKEMREMIETKVNSIDSRCLGYMAGQTLAWFSLPLLLLRLLVLLLLPGSTAILEDAHSAKD